jgi:PAS domain S-box-containing protein
MQHTIKRQDPVIHKGSQLLISAGLSVSLLGFLGILGRLLNIPVLGSFDITLGMVDAMSLDSGVSLFFLGIGIILSFQLDLAIAEHKLWRRFHTVCLSIPFLISSYTLFLYLFYADFSFWLPLIHGTSKISMSFSTAVNLSLVSFGLIAFNRHRKIWWIPYCLGLIGLFAFEAACFSLIGRWSNIPVLFSFVQAIPTSIALIIIGLLLIYETVPYQGFISPLFSYNRKIRRLSLLGIAISLIIMAAGVLITQLFHTVIVTNAIPIQVDTLFVAFEFSTILLSTLVMALSLRILVFFENSILAEQNAKDSEMRFRLLVSAVQDYAIYRLDQAGCIETWNEGAECITGYQANEIIGKPFDLFYPPDEVAKDIPRQQLEIAAVNGHSETQGWLIRKDRQRFWGRGSLTVIHNEVGDLVGFSNVIQDLTAQKHMEDSWKTSLEELSNMKKAIDAAAIVAITDCEGIITYVNDAFCRISEYTKDELIGQTYRIVNSGYHSKVFFDQLWHTINRGQIWHGEIRNRTKDGTFYWVDTTIFPFQGVQDKSECYISIHHDITPLKLAEEELKKNAQQQNIISLLGRHALSGLDINRLLEQTVILATQALKAPYGAIMELEPKGSSLVMKAGYGWQDIQVGSFSVSSGKDSQSGFTLLVDEPVVIENYATERRFKPPYFVQKYSLISSISVVIRGESIEKPFGVLIIHTTEPRKFDNEDIFFLQMVANVLAMAIERKRSEILLQEFNLDLEEKIQTRTRELEIAKQDAEEANRQKTKVLAFVSHDFKNPLAAMSRFADILNKQEDKLTEKQHEFIQYIIDGITQLRAMVSSILDKARLEEGKLMLSLEWVELAPLLQDLKSIIDSLAEQRGVSVSIEVDPPGLGVEADPHFLRQIILNLVSNAIKYNKRNGQVWIKIYDTEQHQFVVIEVRDTGIGIPEENIPALFKEYFRIGQASYEQVEGTGLGLAFIKQLIGMHGGQIQVKSQVGIGSIFTVTLPNRMPVTAPQTLPSRVD